MHRYSPLQCESPASLDAREGIAKMKFSCRLLLVIKKRGDEEEEAPRGASPTRGEPEAGDADSRSGD